MIHMQNRYRQVREDFGWSRTQMAGKMGVDTTTVGNWETGKRQMTPGYSVEYGAQGLASSV